MVTSPYKPQIELASDIKEAWQSAGVLDTFLIMPPSHQREYIQWIEGAKQPETRARRITKAAATIRQKVK